MATMLWPDSIDPQRNLRQQLLRFRQPFDRSLMQGGATLTVTGIDLEERDEAELSRLRPRD